MIEKIQNTLSQKEAHLYGPQLEMQLGLALVEPM